jgi:hypothetical protein
VRRLVCLVPSASLAIALTAAAPSGFPNNGVMPWARMTFTISADLRNLIRSRAASGALVLALTAPTPAPLRARAADNAELLTPSGVRRPYAAKSAMSGFDVYSSPQ